ncbi:ABC transporter substrate-binding protein [Bacillaceae bacterium SIJ1]|uniref:ABC transporter substrate-binding protein n=1 Tax=Litoribacterium kuwaitense TaxID=1398745 RepID=UPI0013EA5F07|nr:ABC transporter substrate-binding protein [Litoribacterium kuwaitense]NGP45721.1 ABC transporter substrate-binding protein [Litoribacterium kuwaitense]
MLKRYRKLALFVAIFGVVSMVLAACSSGDDSQTANQTDRKEAAEGENTESGGILNIGLSSNAATLDPSLYTGVYEGQIMRSIADTLIVYDQDLQSFIPSLATEWEAADDMMSYTFKLRDDVYFQPGEYQDGRQMTAEDVKFSLERSVNNSAQNRLAGVESVEVTSEFEVKIHLEEPNSALLAMLTDQGNIIIPKEEVEGWGDQFGAHLVGTGPFMLENWQTDQQVDLVKHDNYWGEEPHLDGVTYKFITDPSMRTNALRSGDIDIATHIKGQNREVIKKDENLELLSTPGLSITYLDMNYQQGPTANPKVREAISKATNIEEIVQGVHQWGGGTVAHGPLPKGSWGYDESFESVKAEYNPEEAKEILDQTEYAGGFEIDLYVLESRTNYATIFQNQMKENLNVDVNIQVSEWGTLTETISNNNAPLSIGGWSWYPDPYFFLNPRFHSSQHGSNGNGKAYENSTVDELLDRAVTETVDQEERAALYQEAVTEILEDYATIAFDNLDIATGVTTKVKGFNLSPDESIYVVSPNGANISIENNSAKRSRNLFCFSLFKRSSIHEHKNWCRYNWASTKNRSNT